MLFALCRSRPPRGTLHFGFQHRSCETICYRKYRWWSQTYDTFAEARINFTNATCTRGREHLSKSVTASAIFTARPGRRRIELQDSKQRRNERPIRSRDSGNPRDRPPCSPEFSLRIPRFGFARARSLFFSSSFTFFSRSPGVCLLLLFFLVSYFLWSVCVRMYAYIYIYLCLQYRCVWESMYVRIHIEIYMYIFICMEIENSYLYNFFSHLVESCIFIS